MVKTILVLQSSTCPYFSQKNTVLYGRRTGFSVAAGVWYGAIKPEKSLGGDRSFTAFKPYWDTLVMQSSAVSSEVPYLAGSRASMLFVVEGWEYSSKSKGKE
jgi:hypothetical protein